MEVKGLQSISNFLAVEKHLVESSPAPLDPSYCGCVCACDGLGVGTGVAGEGL